MVKELDQLGFTNWCTNVRNVLKDIYFDDVWDNQCIDDYPHFITLVKERIRKAYIQYWQDSINDSVSSPKLRTYKLFKTTFCNEKYLTCIQGDQLIRAVARLRMSSHDLAIERGRYTKPKTLLNDRTCKRCNLEEIDDEKHFLLRCDTFSIHRQSLLYTCRLKCSNFKDYTPDEQFVFIMTSKDNIIIQSLATFVHKCFK